MKITNFQQVLYQQNAHVVLVESNLNVFKSYLADLS